MPVLGWGKGKECTFAGALEAALAVTDRPFDYVTLMGVSGLAFRTRWFQGPGDRWCPSSPVGEFPEEIEAVERATSWPLYFHTHSGTLTGAGETVTPKETVMEWKQLVESEMEQAYKVTYGLLDLVDEDQLDWKPATGSNWMTTGQLLRHLGDSCGLAVRGFITGDWGVPEDVDMSQMPPAEKLPTVGSVAEAREMLAQDRQAGLDALAQCSEERLATEIAPAPWDPSEEVILGPRLLQMVNHLRIHTAQLFYYLKLQGKPVHTGHLWG